MRICSKCKEEFTENNDGDYYCRSCRAILAQRTRDRHKNKGTSPTPLSDIPVLKFENEMQRWLYGGAKVRANKYQVPFNITPLDIIIPTHCPILGIKLYSYKGKGPHDNSPSLDRCIPERGYVIGNINIISHKANTIKRHLNSQ